MPRRRHSLSVQTSGQWISEPAEVSDQALRLGVWCVNEAMANYFVNLAFADARCRIADRLLLWQRGFGRRDSEGVRVDHNLSLDVFSFLAGVTRDARCAMLRDLEDRSWPRVEHDSVAIVDAEDLKRAQRMDMLGASCV
jgi:CRP/FNR family cyclic AMP-dependent transcriptional regulator